MYADQHSDNKLNRVIKYCVSVRKFGRNVNVLMSACLFVLSDFDMNANTYCMTSLCPTKAALDNWALLTLHTTCSKYFTDRVTASSCGKLNHYINLVWTQNVNNHFYETKLITSLLWHYPSLLHKNMDEALLSKLTCESDHCLCLVTSPVRHVKWSPVIYRKSVSQLGVIFSYITMWKILLKIYRSFQSTTDLLGCNTIKISLYDNTSV